MAEVAINDAQTESATDPAKTIGRKQWYQCGPVYLVLFPTPEMLWSDWTTAARVIDWFVTQYEAMDMDFDVLVLGRKVGSGTLDDMNGSVA